MTTDDRLTIDDIPIDDIEGRVLAELVTLAGQGSVPAASAALAYVERVREKRAGEQHALTLATLTTSGDWLALTRYLGTVAATPDEAAAHLGRAMTTLERTSYDRGQDARIVEARAVELAAMRSRGGKAPRWATTKYTR